ncbi:MAG: folate-binding protein [Aeromicrobium sp.]|uniref:CAF17-like 4Fe-4S cluster assembly/insertion protein YgfZ n=1 Tax=Aeromicrobium sp. TaxID=1871063 RepID=UPI0039E5A966
MSASERRSPLLDLPGAVEADAPDAGVAAHYGSLVPEQRRLAAGEAFVDLSHRDVLTISGPDRLAWLHDLTTQHVRELAPGTPTSALILSPQGRVEHGFDLVDDGTTVWAHTEPGAGAALIAFLDRMRFMSRVEVSDVGADWAVVGLPGLAWELRPRAELAALPETVGAPVGLWAWEAARIAAGRPRIGHDTDDKTIPNEANLLGVAVHLDKGCYRGQETVARVHTLGRPPRRLTLLHLDGSVDRLPQAGAEVMAGERRAGRVGMSARHGELGPIALALVKRSVPITQALVVDGVAAAQEVVVDPEVGLHVRPRMRS